MKRILSVFVSMLVVLVLSAAPDKSPQEAYIEKYAPLAVEEMYRSGVPASITLAQGLLESRYGLSELAVKGNNHFGIKCHNWNGKKIYHDDDRRGECFRKYKSPDESFRDHSDFLRYRDRYKFLFDLKPTDYKGWAHGLKKAGYATDPSYPQKLIRLIEEYDLDEYDSRKSSWARKSKRKKGVQDEEVVEDAEEVVGLPESPNRLEQAKLLDRGQRDVLHVSFERPVYSFNGVPFVRAREGETYRSLAKSNSLFLKEILRFNELGSEQPLEPGTVVYIQPKKNRSAKGLDKHIVEGDDENLREISQRYAVKLKKLCKMNGMAADEKLIDGEVIILR